MPEIGCFVTSHGFGHASRVCAVVEALKIRAEIFPHIFATTGAEIFSETLDNVTYHELLSDIGFVQNDSFHIDLEATCTKLHTLIPYREKLINRLAEQCAGYRFLLCDISGLGVQVAAKAGISSVLVENFTWDWIYSPYREQYPQIAFFADYLADIYRLADIHIQAEPVCRRSSPHLTCSPVFRKIRPNPVKLSLKYPQTFSRKLVLITLGGIRFSPPFLDVLQKYDDFFFIFAGQQNEQIVYDNVLYIGHSSTYYHPDLINSVDIVVCKSGYSTLAECYQAGKPTICVQRQGFCESKVLEDFAKQHMDSPIISKDEFLSGNWLKFLPDCAQRRGGKAKRNGADEIADFLFSHFNL